MTSLLVECETALYMTNRFKTYIEFLHQLSTISIRINFQTTVIKLYAHIFEFFTRAIRIYRVSTSHRALRAFWTKNDIVEFEKTCNELEVKVDIETRNCDRTLDVQNRKCIEKLKQNLQKMLEKLKQFRQFQESLNRLEIKIDLNKLSYAKEAMYNFYENDNIICHFEIRIDLLRSIYDWVRHFHNKNIFWLSDWTNIDKSTISQIVIEWLTAQNNFDDIDFDVNFFFKRDENDRDSTSRFFFIITRQLVSKISKFHVFVAKMIIQNSLIFDKTLNEQFDKLIYRSLHQVNIITNVTFILIIIVNVLNECEKKQNMKTIIDL